MRRLLPYLSGSILVAAAVVAVAMASGTPTVPPAPSAAESAAPTPESAQERCVAQVTDLLGQSLQAVQDGYTGGLDTNQVAARYGVESAVFKAFTYSQSELIGDVMAHGADGALVRIAPRVQQQCADWSQR